MNKAFFKNKFSVLTDDELLDLYRNHANMQQEAILAAMELLEERGNSSQLINFKAKFKPQLSTPRGPSIGLFRNASWIVWTTLAVVACVYFTPQEEGAMPKITDTKLFWIVFGIWFLGFCLIAAVADKERS